MIKKITVSCKDYLRFGMVSSVKLRYEDTKIQCRQYCAFASCFFFFLNNIVSSNQRVKKTIRLCENTKIRKSVISMFSCAWDLASYFRVLASCHISFFSTLKSQTESTITLTGYRNSRSLCGYLVNHI